MLENVSTYSELESDIVLAAPIEEERTVTHLTTSQPNQCECWNRFFSRFSVYERLQRSLAYVLRFIFNSSHPQEKNVDNLSVPELQSSSDLILHILQRQHLSREIDALNKNRPLLGKKLLSLKPFLDENNFVRVGGRLEHAEITVEQKHPILLPSDNHVVKLMLSDEHKRLGHLKTVLSNFRLR